VAHHRGYAYPTAVDAKELAEHVIGHAVGR
jgi:hypothetical protein